MMLFILDGEVDYSAREGQRKRIVGSVSKRTFGRFVLICVKANRYEIRVESRDVEGERLLNWLVMSPDGCPSKGTEKGEKEEEEESTVVVGKVYASAGRVVIMATLVETSLNGDRDGQKQIGDARRTDWFRLLNLAHG